MTRARRRRYGSESPERESPDHRGACRSPSPEVSIRFSPPLRVIRRSFDARLASGRFDMPFAGAEFSSLSGRETPSAAARAAGFHAFSLGPAATACAWETSGTLCNARGLPFPPSTEPGALSLSLFQGHRDKRGRRDDESRDREYHTLFTPAPRPEDRYASSIAKDANEKWQDKIDSVIRQSRHLSAEARAKLEKLREKRVFVGSVPPNVTEAELAAVFKSFGTIKRVTIPATEDGARKNHAFIDFETTESAQTAIQAMEGFQLCGRRIHVAPAGPTAPRREPPKDEDVKRVSLSKRPTTAATGLFGVATYQQFASQAESEDLANPVKGSRVVKVCNLPQGFSEAEIKQVFDVFGPVMNLDHYPHRREAFVHFFEKSDANTAVATMHGFSIGGNTLHVTLDARNGVAPSTLIVLKNLMDFDDLDDDVKDEIYQECKKHGKVVEVRVHVVPDTKEVRAFALYQLPEQANRAVRVLNNRSFAKRKVKCDLYDMSAYSKHKYDL
ncbi:RNA recognition motif-containing protein [Besnoitia besnoiti]|uniref:RNA recognition motif-containing protein n=1 Tax=Besnoitia besnoiti TaxID=94643 RepID=A0A2A9M6J2_BESBE|nr:RNA recognition motif-containing protein [Besnoitia besnoiti]PFH31931.1 RNA recognition motif-containing protein [Besnoitia besnoiti]